MFGFLWTERILTEKTNLEKLEILGNWGIHLHQVHFLS